MTAVLQASDVLNRNRTMASLDDNTINYASSTDWKAKYMEVADMLAETRAELDDFHGSSKELEEELERELERTEKAQQDLKVKVARAEHERDEWKSKFMSLQTTHNMTTTSLQRELDTLRGEHQKIKVQLRELEMGNDDLERNERAISSSLADVESKYGRVLEEKILLEHELMDKANVEEECQRLKDELRDANEEINIMKDQLAAAQSRPPTMTDTESSARSVTSTAPSSISDDNLLSVAAPSDLCLADLSPDSETSARETKETPKYATPRPIRSPTIPGYTPSPLLHRSTYKVSRLATPPTSSSPSMARSSTVPSLSTPSRLPPRTPVPRPTASRNVSSFSSTSTSSGVPGTTSRSKGVQMVSEMRARVKVLEQKIHTRVPRLRMGSTISRTTGMPPPPPPKAGPSFVSVSPAPSTSSTRSMSNDERLSPSKPRRLSIDSERDRKRASGGDSSGWVLIMDDSPSPAKDKDKERKRASSPSAPSAFRPLPATPHDSPSPTGIPRAPSALSQSTMHTGIRRPQSTVSEGRSSISTNATTSTASSIPTPSSRPTTPTYLPLPTYGGPGHGLKLSTGLGSGPYQLKRSSLGAPARSSPIATSPPANITTRPMPKSSIANSMSQSRIGKPTTHSAGRRSVGEASGDEMLTVRDLSRARSGSTTALYGKKGG
ncbi:uncharacterized protein C8Q71DRAFT_756756 [Rhodofomes roseus]|uniref:NUDE domain-containing protein n=1 Tax=Rhodofomes roseus TaxID=34475 RepID=A0ABQ8KHW4_9APHY|nr:uncharacterized protein C8Q71DRAFT_756756 [Rhodofomes roseus]KAH9837086.1 hypothetical protein C8Q71DRAFT_756756 [Rhodofomes roseus]